MKKLFVDTRTNDQGVRTAYSLSEEIMMENAASALEAEVKKHCFSKSGIYLNRPNVLILCGTGNNGADGYALARRLNGHSLSVTVCAFGEPKSETACLQKERALKAGVFIIDPMESDDYFERMSIDLTVIVDCIFGTGFRGDLPFEASAVIHEINQNKDAYKIACDIPSGLDKLGNGGNVVFKADTTVTMGAYKIALFSDRAKDLCGEVVVADLGIDRNNFENAGAAPEAFLLEESEMELPYRSKQNVNKGSFGHAALVMGEKKGACVIAGSAALRFGCGLVTLVSQKEAGVPYELMNAQKFPTKTTAVALGMGLGLENDNSAYYNYLLDNPKIKCVLDADVFYDDKVSAFIEQKCQTEGGIVLTPHPKEFASLLMKCGCGDYTVNQVIDNRIDLVKMFCNLYEGAVLVLKGSNVVIGQKQPLGQSCSIYINDLGCSSLAKAGSGDVLTGLVVSLLAQGYEPIKAAVTASLAHAKASTKVKNDFSLTPMSLIESIVEL